MTIRFISLLQIGALALLSLAPAAPAQVDLRWDAASGILPEDVVPTWRLTSGSTCTTPTATLQPTYLEIDTTLPCQGGTHLYENWTYNGGGVPSSGFYEVEARMQVVRSANLSADEAVAWLLLVHPQLCPWIVRIDSDRIEFSYLFEPGITIFVDTMDAMHDYRIESDALGFEGRFYFDGQLVATINTAQTSCLMPGPHPSGVSFGQISPDEPGITRWEYVAHNVGSEFSYYCDPAPVVNSTGFGASLNPAGSRVVVDNNFRLFARSLPPNGVGYFLCSTAYAAPTPLSSSQGQLCLGGSIGRFNRPGEIQVASPTGSVLFATDLTTFPQPGGSVAVLPGDTWHFQYWYRDANPMLTSNLSFGLQVVFQ